MSQGKSAEKVVQEIRRKTPYSLRHREYVCSLVPSLRQTSAVVCPRTSSTSAWRNLVMIGSGV